VIEDLFAAYANGEDCLFALRDALLEQGQWPELRTMLAAVASGDYDVELPKLAQAIRKRQNHIQNEEHLAETAKLHASIPAGTLVSLPMHYRPRRYAGLLGRVLSWDDRFARVRLTNRSQTELRIWYRDFSPLHLGKVLEALQ